MIFQVFFVNFGDLIMPWSPKEIPLEVEEYFASQRWIVIAQRKLLQQFGKQKAPSRKVILGAVTNFREICNAGERKSSGWPQTSRSTSFELYKINISSTLCRLYNMRK